MRGYLGYVDAMAVHWLALPGDDRDQITPDMIADVAAGAFTGGHAAAPVPQAVCEALFELVESRWMIKATAMMIIAVASCWPPGGQPAPV